MYFYNKRLNKSPNKKQHIGPRINERLSPSHFAKSDFREMKSQGWIRVFFFFEFFFEDEQGSVDCWDVVPASKNRLGDGR